MKSKPVTNGKGRRKFNYIPPDEMSADEQRRTDTDEEEQFEEEDYEGIAAGSSNEEEATDEEEMEDEAEEDEEGDLVEDEIEEDEREEDDEEGEEEESDDDDSSDRYEEDIEDERTVKERRKKLPKSALDDQFFNLAEMNAFLDAQDKVEGERERTGRNLGQFDRAEEMDAIIRAYEEENLQSRNWALQGEAVADERRKDELLEQFMEVDYRTKQAPTITEEKTAQLEAIIKKRIKEKLFDDVVRKFRENEALVPVYRNQTDIEQTVRKSLAEVYEEKFVNQMRDGEEQGTSQSKAELDPAVASIKKDMDSLFLRLDALSHFQFRPQPIREEIKIVNNMPALHMEEVGPTATTQPDVNLLAPEEVMRRVKRAPKASEERDEGDRKRDRRHKKRKQHKLASLGAMGGNAKSDEGEANQKRKKTLKRGKKMDFAGEMQTLISSEMGGSGRRSAKRARV